MVELKPVLSNLLAPRLDHAYLHLIMNLEKYDLPLSSHQGATTADPWSLILHAFCVVHGIMSVVLIYHNGA